MKNITLPFLRIFLLLLLSVGLFGYVKILLLNTTKIVKQSQINSLDILSQQPTTKPLAQSMVRASREHLIGEGHSASREPLANSEFLAYQESSAYQEPLAYEESLTSKKAIVVSEQEASISLAQPFSVVAPIKPSTATARDTLIETPTENSQKTLSKLSELFENNSIDSTLRSLEKVVRDSSNESYYQSETSAPQNIDLSKIERGYKNKVDNNYAFQNDLALQAEKRLQSNVTYDGRYLKMAYPMGDVPSHIGVCTDVVIRAFRGLGIDLQQQVHEDMKRNFGKYPNNWQLKRPDSNIDHRRVPNLMKYFKRSNMSVGISSNPSNYQPGDIVAWDLGRGLTHIGVVSTYVSEINSNPLIVHNIGVGPEISDILFDFKIIGHYKSGKYKTVSLASLDL